MRCGLCGHDNVPEAMVCARCDASLIRATPRCGRCGQRLYNVDGVCVVCGYRAPGWFGYDLAGPGSPPANARSEPIPFGRSAWPRVRASAPYLVIVVVVVLVGVLTSIRLPPPAPVVKLGSQWNRKTFTVSDVGTRFSTSTIYALVISRVKLTSSLKIAFQRQQQGQWVTLDVLPDPAAAGHRETEVTALCQIPGLYRLVFLDRSGVLKTAEFTYAP